MPTKLKITWSVVKGDIPEDPESMTFVSSPFPQSLAARTA
jgi:hypothetical protein